MIDRFSSYKRLKLFWFVFAMICFFLPGTNAVSQNVDIARIHLYAQKGQDSTLILLKEIESNIDFKNANDLALNYYLAGIGYYTKVRKFKEAIALIEKARFHYETSDDEKLKLRYDFSSIVLSTDKIINLESKIRKCKKEATRIGMPDLVIRSNIQLYRICKKKKYSDSLTYYLDEAVQIAENTDLDLLKARVLKILGAISFFKSEFQKSIDLYDLADDIYKDNNCLVDLARVRGLKGRVYSKLGEYQKALRYFNYSMDLFKERKLDHRIGISSQYIGKLYQSSFNHEKAIEYFELAYSTLNENSTINNRGRLNYDLGKSHLELGNYHLAEEYLKKSIKQKEYISDIYTLQESYTELGNLYLKKNDIENAEIEFQRAIDFGNEFDLNYYLYKPKLGLLKVYLQKNEIERAKKIGEKGLVLAKEKKDIEYEYRFITSLVKIEEWQGNYKKTNEYYKQIFYLRNRIGSFEDALKVASVMSDYENQKKELENLTLQLENKEKENVIQKNKDKNRIFYLLLFSVVAGLLSLLVFYIQRGRANKKQKALNFELNEVNEELNKQNKDVLESNMQLEQFAHMASHDLKTPLFAITAFSSLLQESSSDKLSKEEREYLDFIIKGGSDLSKIIEDILSYAKTRSQNIVTQETDANILMQNLITTMSGEASRSGVELRLKTSFPKDMNVDQIKIKRVLQNLTSNAIKFSDKSKKLKYVDFSCEELNDSYKISVVDNGIGIPDTTKNIFAPFTYLNMQKDYKGTGIGLAMCEKIINKHGGKIWYESKVGEGASFYFTIKK